MIEVKNIETLAQERIEELNNGCYLVEVKVDNANRIIVEVDNETRGLSVEDCVSISRNIEHNLDREKEDFSIEVTSPGLDKPLHVWKQYKKNIGNRVKTKLTDGIAVEGKILQADESGFSMESTIKEKIEGKKKKVTVTKTHQFKYDQITETKLIIAFK